jgi:cyanophycinase
MAASELMIYEGAQHEAMLQGSVRMSSGLRFISGCIIDTHFIKRGRFERLAQSLVMNPTCIGIGLGEDTALLIKEGNKAECKGSGMVIIIDGKDIGHTNVAYAEENIPLSIEGLRVHILSRGTKFLLHERQFVPSDEDLELEREAMAKDADNPEKAGKANKKKSS